jgi:archaellum component FlaC
MSKIEEKLDRLDTRIDSIDKTLERNTVSLETHIKRTDALEDYVKDQVKNDLIPIKNHVNKITNAVQGIFWFCTVVASVCGFLLVLKHLGVF